MSFSTPCRKNPKLCSSSGSAAVAAKHTVPAIILRSTAQPSARDTSKMAKNKKKRGVGAGASEKVGENHSDANNSTSGFPPHLVEACKPPRRKGAPPISPEIAELYPHHVYVSRNFLSPSECQLWIDAVEQNNVGGGFESVCHAATRYIAQRECGRIQMVDARVADALYDRMRPIVTQVADKVGVTHCDTTYGPVALNENIRLYKYDKGMSFGRHFDGSNGVPSLGETAHTEITVLVYLSGCRGGATRFYPPSSSAAGSTKKKTKKQKKEGSESKDGIAFVPEQGAVLLHVHGDRCLEHEADPVLDGIKYVLRTDVVYAVDGGGRHR